MTAQARSARRSVDVDLNTTPMIDLLLVTISFLLLTAVWTHYARVDADAMTRGIQGPATPRDERRLHLDARDPSRFVLRWTEGAAVIETRDVAREGGERLPGLAAALGDEWRARGAHRDATDPRLDELVLHVADDAPYASVIAAMDAAYAVKRPCGRATCPAFHVTFATR